MIKNTIITVVLTKETNWIKIHKQSNPNRDKDKDNLCNRVTQSGAFYQVPVIQLKSFGKKSDINNNANN